MNKITWEQLVECELDDRKANSWLHRTHEVEAAYSRHKRRFGNKLPQHIVDREFGDELIPYSVSDNPFPYNVEDGIRHQVVWTNPSYPWGHLQDEIVSMVKSILHERNKQEEKQYEAVAIQRKPPDQSVPEIRHFHLFTRLKKKNNES